MIEVSYWASDYLPYWLPRATTHQESEEYITNGSRVTGSHFRRELGREREFEYVLTRLPNLYW